MNSTTQSPNSDTETHGIRIRAAARYLPADSEPDRCKYRYGYTVTIQNDREDPIRLLRRHWIILDANGEREDVRGPGVVGKHPEILPGESFTYDSACPLSTRWGTMEGEYAFAVDGGQEVSAQIGRFFLVPSSALD